MTTPVPPLTVHGPIDSGLITREQLRLVARLEALRKVQALGPVDPPPGMSDADLARRLMYDTLATLMRSELVLQQSAEALINFTEAQETANLLKAEELEIRRVARKLESDRDSRRWTLIGNAASGIGTWFHLILTNPKVTASIIGGLVSVIGTLLAAWGFSTGTLFPEHHP